MATTATPFSVVDLARRYGSSNRILYEHVERAAIPAEQMGALLNARYSTILGLLSLYNPPSAKSESAIKSGKVTIKEQSFTLDAKRTEFVLKLSKLLNLDEVQTFEILYSFSSEELQAKEWSFSDVDREKIIHYYYDERISLIKTISLLFRIEQDDTHAYHTVASELIGKLLKDNLMEKVMTQLKSSSTQQFNHTEHNRNVLASNQMLNEHEALMEVVFLAHYDRVTATAKDLLTFAKFFEQHKFGQRLTSASLMDATSKDTIRRISHLCNLVLIECLALETILPDNVDPKSHPIFKEKNASTQELTHLILPWAGGHDGAPAALALAALLCRIAALNGEEMEAVVTGPGLVSIAAMSKSDMFKGSEPNALPYKSVVRGVVCVLLKAFDVAVFPQTQFGLLVEIAYQLYHDQPGLCQMLWEDREDGMRYMLEVMRARFPVDIQPMLKLLTGLAADHVSAVHVFNFMQQLPSLTAPADYLDPQSIQEDVISTGTLLSIREVNPVQRLVYGYVLPVGTQGYQDNMGNLLWGTYVNGWGVCFYMLDRFLALAARRVEPELINSITEIVRLIQALLSQESDLAIAMSNDLIECQASGCYDLSTDMSLTGLVQRMFSLLQAASAMTPVPLPLLAGCAKTITALAHVAPGPVAAAASRAGVFVSPSSFGTPLWRQLLHSVELPAGEYPVTLAFLDLIRTLLEWQQAASPADRAQRMSFMDITACLSRVRTDILSEYSGWRYVKPLEHWKIGCHALHIFLHVLHDPLVQEKGSVAYELATSVLNDAALHHTLFMALGAGPKAIEELFDSRRIEEGQALEHLIAVAFSLIQFVLHWKSSTSSEDSVLSAMETELLSRRGHDGLDLVTVIAEYIFYLYHSDRSLPPIALLATKMLTLLCHLAPKLKSRAPSIASFFGPKAAQLRKAYLGRLNDRRESEELRVAILELVTVALDTQPGLAELFINLPHKVSDAAADIPDTSCLSCVLLMVRESQSQMKQRPRLVMQALALLYALWQVAADHRSIVTRLRGRATFWNDLAQPLLSTELSETSETNVTKIVLVEQDEIPSCYRQTSRAFVLRIMAVELVIAAGAHNKLKDVLAGFANDGSYEKWLSNRPMTTLQAAGTAFEGFKRALKEVGGDASVFLQRSSRVYGTDYLYDTTLIRKTFGDGVLVDLTQLLNLAESKADSYLLFLRGVRELVSIAAVQNCLSPAALQIKLPLSLLRALGKTLAEGTTTMETSSNTLSDSPAMALDASERANTFLFIARQLLRRNSHHEYDNPDARAHGIELLGLLEPVLSHVMKFPTLDTLFTGRTGVDTKDFPPDIRSSLVNSLTILAEAASEPPRESVAPSKAPLSLQTATASSKPPALTSTAINMFGPATTTPGTTGGTSSTPVAKSGSGSSQQDAATQQRVLMQSVRVLLPLVGQCLSVPSLTTDAAACIGSLTRCVMSTEWIGVLDQGGVFGALVRAIPAQPVSESDTDTITRIDAVLSILCKLAVVPNAAESIASNGLMLRLAISDALGSNLPAYLPSGEHSPLHTYAVRLVAIMVRTLGFSQSFLEKAIEFVIVHQNRIISAMQFNDDMHVTLCGLTETEHVVRLLCELSRHWSAVQFAMPERSYMLTSALLSLFQLFTSLLESHQQLDSLSRAMSKSEKLSLIATRPEPKKSERPPSRSTSPVPFQRRRSPPPSPTPFAKPTDSKEVPPDTVPFYIQVEDAMYSVLRMCLTAVCHMSAKVFAARKGVEGLDESAPTLFSPYTRVTALNDTPSIGTLLACQHHVVNALDNMSVDPHTIHRHKKLITLFDLSLHSLVSHATLYLARARLGDPVAREMGSEYVTKLQRQAVLAKETQAPEEIVSLLQKASIYLQFLITGGPPA